MSVTRESLSGGLCPGKSLSGEVSVRGGLPPEWRPLPPCEQNDRHMLLKTLPFCARFIRTVCMRRIRWSCECLTFVHNEYTWYTLKHLLLRHMYNLSLLKLCATLLVDPLLLVLVLECDWLTVALYCAVPYIAACVDVSRTVFRDRSSATSFSGGN